MLDIIKNRIANIATTYTNMDLVNKELLKLASDIEKFQSEDSTTSDLHRTFRTLERYSTMYKIAVEEYLAIPVKELHKRSFQLQEILCLLTLITSAIVSVLRKYNSSDDKGTLGKHLRTLNNNLEYYKAEKISWTTMLKAITTLFELRITEMKEAMQESLVREGE